MSITAKSSIHSIMRKKSPCKGRLDVEITDRDFNKENSTNTTKELNDLRSKYYALEEKYSQALV
jgi:hypothetical protein